MTHPADGRVALISGANRGIGAAVAHELAAHGWRVSLGARDLATLDAAFGPPTETRLHCRFDAADKASAEAWVSDSVAAFGRIDALINNAGTNERVTIMDDDDEALDRIWSINVKAPLRMTRLCLPYLEQTGSGRIINVASMSGKRVRNPHVGYNMSKYAVMGLTHTTRFIGWDKGVRATAVCPSFVRTDMTADATRVTPDEMIQPEDLARLIRTTIELPNTAAIAELLVNCTYENTL